MSSLSFALLLPTQQLYTMSYDQVFPLLPESWQKLRMQIFVQLFTLSSEQIARYWFTPHCWELMK
jgi:hypothetical protein